MKIYPQGWPDKATVCEQIESQLKCPLLGPNSILVPNYWYVSMDENVTESACPQMSKALEHVVISAVPEM